MTMLYPWDWHYRVGFDATLCENIKCLIDQLPDQYKQVYIQQFILFKELVSLSQLISFLCDEKPTADVYGVLNTINGKRLLFVPQVLKHKYKRKIRYTKRLSFQEKKELFSILEKASHLPFENYHQAIFDPVFGEDMHLLLRQVEKGIELRMEEKPLIRQELRLTIENIIHYLRSCPPAKLHALVPLIPDFDISVLEGTDFAEYWPTSLTGEKTNKLLVYDHENHLGYHHLTATIAHEIIGHATFYRLADDVAPSFFDHGALALVEGWATWCEWTASRPDIAKHNRSAQCHALGRMLKTNPEHIQQTIIEDVSLLGYSHAVAETSIEYFFQYPGFMQFYILGALWFEKRFVQQEPRDFLETLAKQPWGDFFTLW